MLVQRKEGSVWLGHLCGRSGGGGSPVVEATPVYSGDAASAGELAEETPAEWTERAGEKDSGDWEAGVVSASVNSSSLSAVGKTGIQCPNRGVRGRTVGEGSRSGSGGGLTCAALPLHGPHQVVGSLLTVQRLQQVEHVVVKHEVDQVEGACVETDAQHELRH